MGLGFAGLGLITQGYRILPQPLLQLYPQAAVSLTSSVMGISFLLGLAMSGVSILAQTTLQEASPPDVRGRVFALQFMLNNLIGIPPMLTIGGLADWVGIPQVMLMVGGIVLAASVISTYFSLSPARRRSLKCSLRRAAVAVRHPRAWYARQEWLANLRDMVRRGLRGCRQAWHVICGGILRVGAKLGLRQRSAVANPSGATPSPAHESDSHAEEPAGSASEQHPED
jgi:MFS family permease